MYQYHDKEDYYCDVWGFKYMYVSAREALASCWEKKQERNWL